MVYDEWGAVLRHQDEMDKAIKAKEKQMAKDNQLRYKMDLEEQKEMQR
jgi:hypothetical protein